MGSDYDERHRCTKEEKHVKIKNVENVTEKIIAKTHGRKFHLTLDLIAQTPSSPNGKET